MSWARYWATRASAELQASAATPLPARSWLTRENSTPAAPPTPVTGGDGGRGAGGLGASGATERGARAGWLEGAWATTGAGEGVGAAVGSGVSRSSRLSAFGPAFRTPKRVMWEGMALERAAVGVAA